MDMLSPNVAEFVPRSLQVANSSPSDGTVSHQPPCNNNLRAASSVPNELLHSNNVQSQSDLHVDGVTHHHPQSKMHLGKVVNYNDYIASPPAIQEKRYSVSFSERSDSLVSEHVYGDTVYDNRNSNGKYERRTSGSKKFTHTQRYRFDDRNSVHEKWGENKKMIHSDDRTRQQQGRWINSLEKQSGTFSQETDNQYRIHNNFYSGIHKDSAQERVTQLPFHVNNDHPFNKGGKYKPSEKARRGEHKENGFQNQARLEWPSVAVQRSENVSYKKILTRRGEPSMNMLPTQSDKEWPSLSNMHLSPDNKLPNTRWVLDSDLKNEPVLFKQTLADSSSSPSTKPVVYTLEEEQVLQENMYKSRHKGKVNHNKLAMVETPPSYDRMFERKPSQFEEATNELSSSHKDTLSTMKYKDRPMQKTVFRDSRGNDTESSERRREKVKRDKNVKPKNPDVKKNDTRLSSLQGHGNADSEEVMPLNADETVEWQVIKKKKPKGKEQREGSSRPSRNSKAEFGKSSFGNEGSKTRNDILRNKQNPNYESRLKNGEKQSQGRNFSNSLNKATHKKCSDNERESDKKWENLRSRDVIDGSQHKLQIPKKSFNNDGRERSQEISHVKRRINMAADTSGTNTANAKEFSSSRFESPKTQSRANPQDKKTKEETEAQRRLKEQKKKKREENMRRREIKLWKAQAILKADTKVTVITKDVLELLHRGNSSQKANQVLGPSVEESNFMRDFPSLIKRDYGKADVCDDITEEAVVGNDECDEDWISDDEPQLPSHGHATLVTSETEKPKLGNIKRAGRAETKANNQVRRDGTTSEITVASKLSALNDPSSSFSVVPNYSKALLSAPKTQFSPIKSPERPDMAKNAIMPKKKVKTKDGMTFDLLTAATKMKVKKNKKQNNSSSVHNMNKANTDMLDLYVPKKKLKKREKNRERLFAGLGPTITEVSMPQVSGGTSPTKPSKVSKLTGLKVTENRGKQREGGRKKKLTTLRKAMIRNRQMEIEKLKTLLQEAKQLQRPSSILINGSDISYQEETVNSSSVTQSTPDRNNEVIGLTNDTELIETLNSDESVKETATSENLNILKSPIDLMLNPRSPVFEPGQDSKPETSIDAGADCGTSVDSFEKNIDITINQPDGVSSTNGEHIVERCDERRSSEEASDRVFSPEFSSICKEIVDEIRMLENPVHKMKFREYCNHVITPEVNTTASQLLRSLVGFQNRLYERDPIKGRIRRRYVCGLKCTTKTMGKLACVIVAPNIAPCKGPGALDEVVEKMLNQAKENGVPVIFALSCRKIGLICKKKVPVSCVGIINYQGAE
ncbi:hypothetical protein SK128_023489, partial [Halocaridina rubra]